MAEKEESTTDPAAEGDEADVVKRAGMIHKIRLAVFLLVVVLAECGFAFMIIPSAEDTAAMMQAVLATTEEEDVEDTLLEEEEVEEELPKIEVDLGEYGITSYQPVTNTTLRIDFHLFATVLETDESDFSSRFTDNQQRMRDQVLVVLRSSEEPDLTDPGLGLIKRKILASINHTLGKPLLQEVVFSDFSLVEQ